MRIKYFCRAIQSDEVELKISNVRSMRQKGPTRTSSRALTAGPSSTSTSSATGSPTATLQLGNKKRKLEENVADNGDLETRVKSLTDTLKKARDDFERSHAQVATELSELVNYSYDLQQQQSILTDGIKKSRDELVGHAAKIGEEKAKLKKDLAFYKEKSDAADAEVFMLKKKLEEAERKLEEAGDPRVRPGTSSKREKGENESLAFFKEVLFRNGVPQTPAHEVSYEDRDIDVEDKSWAKGAQ